jgi:hypothetical protein
MFVSSTVNLRPNPSTHYSHSQKYAHALQEVKRFKHFFMNRVGELGRIHDARKALDATVQKHRSSEETVRLLSLAEGEGHYLLLDEWVADPSSSIRELKEFHRTWFRAVTHQGWTDPAGWSVLDLIQVLRCFHQVDVYLDRVVAEHESRILHGPRTEWNTCPVSVSQMLSSVVLESLSIFRSCVDELSLAFREAWEVLEPRLQYQPESGELDWSNPSWPKAQGCAACGTELASGDPCIAVNGTRGAQGLVCVSCVAAAKEVSDGPE